MKISSKKAVEASITPVTPEEPAEIVEEVVQDVPADNDSAELDAMILEDVRKDITSAIKRLGAYVKRTGDKRAKDSIANLSVVLLDLQ